MAMDAKVRAGMAALSMLVTSTAAAQDRTARELIDVVVREGPQAAAIRAGVDVTRSEQAARLAYPNPGVIYSREGAGFTEFLQAEQTLLIFGTQAALSRAGVAATSAAEAERDARLWALQAIAAGAVARLGAEQARLETAESYVAEIERVIEVLQVREREGEGSRFDRLRAEQERYEAARLVTEAAVAMTEARGALAALLPPDVPVGRVIDPIFAPRSVDPLASLQARARGRRPELRALEASRERTEHESDAAKKARLPAPTIFGGMKRADTGSERATGGIFGVSLSVPLFDTGAREAARWSAERLRIDAERTALEHEIHTEIARAVDTLALRQAAVRDDPQGSAADLTQIAAVAYREGAIGILELLDAFRTASRARLRSIDIQFEARLAQIALERAVGDILWP